MTCALCHAKAIVHCVQDDALLCNACDIKFHSNPLAARHERRPLQCVEHECVSVAGQTSESCDGVVPQAGPKITMFDDFFPMPSSFMDPAMDDLCGDLLSDPLSDDILNFDFGVVPTVSEGEEQVPPPAALFPEVPASLFASAPGYNPFIHTECAVPQTMMVPTEAPAPTPEAVAGRTAKRSRAAALDLDSYMDDEDIEEDDEDDDDSDGEFVVAPRRSHASRARREAAAAATVTAATEPELTRAERVARYREKRARRNFKKTIRYQSRKAYAEVRPRIKGRFVSPEEYAAYMAEHKMHDAEAVVPVC